MPRKPDAVDEAMRQIETILRALAEKERSGALEELQKHFAPPAQKRPKKVR